MILMVLFTSYKCVSYGEDDDKRTWVLFQSDVNSLEKIVTVYFNFFN